MSLMGDGMVQDPDLRGVNLPVETCFGFDPHSRPVFDAETRIQAVQYEILFFSLDGWHRRISIHDNPNEASRGVLMMRRHLDALYRQRAAIFRKPDFKSGVDHRVVTRSRFELVDALVIGFGLIWEKYLKTGFPSFDAALCGSAFGDHRPDMFGQRSLSSSDPNSYRERAEDQGGVATDHSHVGKSGSSVLEPCIGFEDINFCFAFARCRLLLVGCELENLAAGTCVDQSNRTEPFVLKIDRSEHRDFQCRERANRAGRVDRDAKVVVRQPVRSRHPIVCFGQEFPLSNTLLAA